MLVPAVSALAVLPDEPGRSEKTDWRRAIVEADRKIAAEKELRAVEDEHESSLLGWLKAGAIPVFESGEPTAPAPGPCPSRKDLVMVNTPVVGFRPGDSPRRFLPARHRANVLPALIVPTEFHVPSAYLKYLSIHFHAGPPA